MHRYGKGQAGEMERKHAARKPNLLLFVVHCRIQDGLYIVARLCVLCGVDYMTRMVMGVAGTKNIACDWSL